jgi:hypothetical protein
MMEQAKTNDGVVTAIGQGQAFHILLLDWNGASLGSKVFPGHGQHAFSNVRRSHVVTSLGHLHRHPTPPQGTSSTTPGRDKSAGPGHQFHLGNVFAGGALEIPPGHRFGVFRFGGISGRRRITHILIESAAT